MVLGRAAGGDCGKVAIDRQAGAHAPARDALPARLRGSRLPGRSRAAARGARAPVAALDARSLRSWREDELQTIAESGAVIATNPSSNLHLRSGVAPIAEAIRRGCRVAIGVDASAFDEDDDILREMRLGHFLHGGWGFDSVVERGEWLAKTVTNGRFANGAPGDGSLRVGAPADILVLDLDALDRDAVMAVEPIDLVFARATAAHVAHLFVAGREIVRDGRPTLVDLEAAEAALKREYREKIPSRAAFLEAWNDLEPAIAAHYRAGLGCC